MLAPQGSSPEPGIPSAAAFGQTRRFRFHRCLGKGGFGEVYRAEMITGSGLHRTVAVKTLHANLQGNDDAVRRLRDEARLLGVLHHPGIVQVYDLVELQGQLALVTEYLDGEDLDRVLKTSGPLPERVALEVVRDVAAALHAAYNRTPPGSDLPMRLVHRDIKPSNVRITSGGAVKLLDFGIAMSPELDRDAKTGTGLVIGTMGYLSPDRLTAEEVDPRSDVYGLGCVLFEAVRRQRLYHQVGKAELFRLALDPEAHDAFVTERMATIPEGGRALEPRLVDLMKRTLAYDPEDRPTAAELEVLCDDLAADLPGAHLRRWARGRRWAEPAWTDGKLDGLELSASGMINSLGPPISADHVTAGFTSKETPDATLPLPAPHRGTAKSAIYAVSAFAALLGVAASAAGGWWALGPSGQEPAQEAMPVPVVDTSPATPAPEPEPEPEPEPDPSVADTQLEPAASRTKAPAPKPAKPPTPKPERPPAAQAKGVVQFTSIPYSASITVDGSLVVKAKAPVQLTAGQHTVTLRSADGRSTTQSFRVDPEAPVVFCWDYDRGTLCR